MANIPVEAVYFFMTIITLWLGVNSYYMKKAGKIEQEKNSQTEKDNEQDKKIITLELSVKTAWNRLDEHSKILDRLESYRSKIEVIQNQLKHIDDRFDLFSKDFVEFKKDILNALKNNRGNN